MTKIEPKTHKITSKPLSFGLLATSIIGGIGGAILLGILLEDLTRSIFGLSEFNLFFLISLGILITLLGIVGTGALVAAFYIDNKTIRAFTVAFSLPIPIVFEVVDLTIRFMNLIPDIYAHYDILM